MLNKFYVYFLVDPRNPDPRFRLPFYIGKGCGERAEMHLKENKEDTINHKKWCKIQSIRNSGHEPEIHIIYSNLVENLAYDLEENLIKFYGRKGIDKGGILTNICIGNRPPSRKNKPQTELTKKKISTAQIGEKNHRFGKGYLQLGKNNPNYGRKMPEEERKRRSELMSGPRHPQYGKFGKNHQRYGKTGSCKKTTCPRCGFTGGSNNMKRYHFDNCKN